MCFKYVHETQIFAFPSIWPWAAMISVLHVLLPLCAHPQGHELICTVACPKIHCRTGGDSHCLGFR